MGPAQFASSSGVVPDGFQSQAMAALESGRSVLVAAPTGSGKTLIAAYAIARARSLGQRAVYTAPIKALSNQKFQELVEDWGPAQVGLITGDRSIRPDADIVVMTTEVLRAMLENPGEGRPFSTVVLDEFHYLHDPERGSVWEEVVMLAAPETVLVCLSATLSDRDEVAAWLDRAHPSFEVVSESARPVPLAYHYAIGNLQDHPPVMVSMLVDGQPNPSGFLADGSRRDSRGEGLRQRERNRPTSPSRAALFRALQEQSMDPAIWFLLSRNGCDRAAADFVKDGPVLLDPETQRRARAFGADVADSLSEDDARAGGLHDWLIALEHGVAVHHSGLLPVMREAVERAFAGGLLRLVFATETLAVGVNLPARTVVIDRIMRGRADHAVMLGADSFTQLAGRAGRRGLDTVGHVVVPWSTDVSFGQAAALIGGRPQQLVSRLVVSPALAANLFSEPGGLSPAVALDRSLAAHLQCGEAAMLRAEVERLTAHVEAEAAELGDELGRAPDREDRPPRLSATTDVMTGLELGDLIRDPGRRSRGMAAVVGKGTRRGVPFVWVVSGDARRVQWDASAFRQPPEVVGHVELGDIDLSARGAARAVARRVEAAQPSANAHPVRDSEARIETRADARGRMTRLAASRRLLEARQEELDLGADRVAREYRAMLNFLESRGAVGPDGLTGMGEMLRRLYHPSGLLVAEILETGLVDQLGIPELAGFASFFVGASRGPGAPPPSSLSEIWKVVSRRGSQLNDAQDECGLPRTASPEAGMAGAVWRWARGGSLTGSIGTGEIPPGDFVRVVRQVIELLMQVQRARPALAEVAAAAIAALDRDAVAATVPSEAG